MIQTSDIWCGESCNTKGEDWELMDSSRAVTNSSGGYITRSAIPTMEDVGPDDLPSVIQSPKPEQKKSDTLMKVVAIGTLATVITAAALTGGSTEKKGLAGPAKSKRNSRTVRTLTF